MTKRNFFNVCFLSHFSTTRILTLAVTMCLLCISIARADAVFTAALNGYQAVPATNSTATGIGSVILNDLETKVTVTLSFNGLQNTSFIAQIHSPATRGATAEMIFSLPGSVSTQTFPITESEAADLKAGLWYFNVTTQNFPNGEIRGQIEPLCAPPPTNMVNWYRAENNLSDSIGNNNANPPGNVSYLAGKAGQAFNFNGADQYANLGNRFDYRTFTVSMWVKPGATQTAYANLVDNNRTESANWNIEQFQNTTNHYYYSDEGGGVPFILQPNMWQHLTVVRGENVIHIYRNGTLLNWTTASAPVNYDNGQNLLLARKYSNLGAADRNWKGQIDEFTVFNRALSATEIRNLYYSGSAGVCTESAWMPRAHNGKIVFFRSNGSSYQIFTMNNDGYNLTNLTNNPTFGYDHQPSFSPDGNKIVFSKVFDLFVMNADGSNRTNLIFDRAGDELFPRWSPDGSKITFVLRSEDDQTEIYTVNSNGSNLTRLTNNSVHDYDPYWSPDGTKIVFVSQLFGDGIYTMNADGSSIRRIMTGNNVSTPSWSPDGAKIAFTRNFDIYVMKADGTDVVNITNTPTISEQSPNWSPDGKRIVFSYLQNNSNQIWTMYPDGTGQTIVLNNGANYYPVWQPVSVNQNISVSPTVGVNVTFSQIVTPGRTVATQLQTRQLPPLPEGYLQASPIYDIRTSASFTGNVAVSINTGPVSNSSTCGNMRVMHFTDGEWSEYNNATPLFYNDTCTVSQNVQSLSPFMIVHINSAPQTSLLSGKIIYGTTPAEQAAKFVSNVPLTAIGDSFASINTASDGSYLISSLIEGGRYAVTLSKTGDVNGITPFDATLILRYIATGGNDTLTANQRLAADTNNSGTITPFDATQILRFVAAGGQTNSTGAVGNWKLLPAVRNYISLNGSLNNENYEAILIGEINGNWQPPASGTSSNTLEQ